MRVIRRRLVRHMSTGFAASLAFGITALPAQAQTTYPIKPVTLVVPLSAGGVTDIVARYLAQKLSEEWKMSVVIENKLGAGGGVGAEYVAKAPADGYTLIVGTVSSHAINASLYKNLRYDNLRDFAPISIAAAGPNLLVVHPSLPVKSTAELIAYLKANPGKVSYGSTGVGTSTHVLAELFKMTTGTDMIHVPYKGSSQMMTDLLSGQVSLAFDNMPTALAQVRTGKLLPLGVTSAQRWADNPEIPTLSETLPAMVATSWQGVFAPAGTPDAVLDKWSESLQRILKSPDTIARFRELGTNATAMTRADFTAFVRSETERWADVVKRSGASAN